MNVMTPREVQERRERARKKAAALLLEFQFKADGLADHEDVFDAFEMAALWRLACEGYAFSEMTTARMIEATNP